jgi:hypothetical protein
VSLRSSTLPDGPSPPPLIRSALPCRSAFLPHGPSTWDWSPPGAQALPRPCPGGDTLRKVSLGWPHCQVKLPGKAKRRPLRTSNRTQPVPSRARAPAEGEGRVATESREGPETHLRLPPAPALGPTSPGQHKAAARAAARTAARPPGRHRTRPGDRGAGRASRRSLATLQFPSRGGKDATLEWPPTRGPRLSMGSPRGRPGAPLTVPPGTPEVAASTSPGPGRPRPRGACERRRARAHGSFGGVALRPAEALIRGLQSVPPFPTGGGPRHLRTVAKQCGDPRRREAGAGTRRRTPRPRQARRLASLVAVGGAHAGLTHAHPPAPVREDGRFGFSIKALCCAHTKAAGTRFSNRPFGQIQGRQLNFQMALRV